MKQSFCLACFSHVSMYPKLFERFLMASAEKASFSAADHTTIRGECQVPEAFGPARHDLRGWVMLLLITADS